MRTVRAFAAEDKEQEHYGEACRILATANQHLGYHIGLFQGKDSRQFLVYRSLSYIL